MPAVGARGRSRPTADKLLPFLREMEFRALATRMSQRLAGMAPVAPADHTEPAIPEIPPFTAPRSYALIDTAEGLDHWIEAAHEAGFVAIWVAASAVPGQRPVLAGIALALAPGMAAYVPLGHRVAGGLDLAAAGVIPFDTAIEKLRPLLEDPGVLKIGHDIKTDSASAVALGHFAGAA